MKFFKWLLGISVLFICLSFVYLTMFFDLNDYKPELIELVKDKTGRDLLIDEDLNWTFFPNVGIEATGVVLKNQPGFEGKPLLSIKNAIAEIALIPLLSREIEINKLSFNGIEVSLITNKKGDNNLKGLTSASTTKQSSSESTKTESSSTAKINRLHINGITIKNTSINVINHKQNTKQSLTLESFDLAQFDLDKDAKVSMSLLADTGVINVSTMASGMLNISSDLQQLNLKNFVTKVTVKGASIPNKHIDTALTSNISLDLKKKRVELGFNEIQLADIVGKGLLEVTYGTSKPNILLDASFNDVDLTSFFPESDITASSTQQQSQLKTQQATNQEVEPDLSALHMVDAKVSVGIRSIKFKKLLSKDWKLHATLKNGKLNLSQLSSELYQGSLNANAKLDANAKPASYSFASRLKNVKVLPLLKDAADVDVLAGTAGFNINGKGRGLTPTKIKQKLNAAGSIKFADGALYGVNIPQMIRSAEAMLKGKRAPKNDEKKTDFTELSSNFGLKQGEATLSQTRMESPLLRVNGNGKANIITETIDYRLQAEIVASLKGQGSKLDDLTGVPIPLKIAGTFSNPEVSVDSSRLLKNKIEKEKKRATNKLKEKLFKSLGF